MPQHDRTSDVANKLAVAIERLAEKFASIKEIEWTENPFGKSSFRWSIPVVVQTLVANRTAKVVAMEATRPDDTETMMAGMVRPWTLDKRDHLRSVLCLWMYTLAERAKLVDRIAREFPHWRSVSREWGVETYVRIVGSTPSSDEIDVLSEWLGKDVFSFRSDRGIIHGLSSSIMMERNRLVARDWPVFGSYVSSLSR